MISDNIKLDKIYLFGKTFREGLQHSSRMLRVDCE